MKIPAHVDATRAGGPELWIATIDRACTPGHPFYERLNAELAQASFDEFVVERCVRFYKEGGRPSIPAGIDMSMLLVGFLSLSLRAFLGYEIGQATPGPCSLSRIRTRIDLATHQEVFVFVLQEVFVFGLKVLAVKGLLKAETIGVDATTSEANAALRSNVRRDDGTS